MGTHRTTLEIVDGLPQRFWNKVQAEPNTGCWLWDGSVDGGGYGQYWHAGKHRAAHRFSYEALVGPIPDGLQIDHLCRIVNCVNPDHLEPVTHTENLRRGIQPGSLLTHCLHGHPLSGSNLYIRPCGCRQCRACNRAAVKRYTARKAELNAAWETAQRELSA